MSIVKGFSDLIVSGFDVVEPDPARARGEIVVATGRVNNAAGDLSGSSYHLVDIPADALFDPRTAFQVQNWGYAGIRIGTEDDIDALVSVAKADGNVVSPVVQFDAKHGKPAWEVLGYEARPKSGWVSLYAHGPANATGAGHMLFEVHYRFR